MDDRVPSWDEAEQAYQLLGCAQGLAERTLAERSYVLRRFRDKMSPCLADLEYLRNLLVRYFAERRGVAPPTFNTERRILRAFLRWCQDEGILAVDVMRGIKRRRENDVPRAVDCSVLIKLLQLPDTSTFCGRRDLALLMLMLDSGIRPKEAFALQVSDIDLRGLAVAVRAEYAKTGRSRMLPISHPTAEAIRQFMEARRETWDDIVPVFSTDEGRPMSRFLWASRLDKYSKMMGTKVRPYDLRHSFAVNLLRNGGNALALQKLLGHSTLAMTRRYVSLTEADLKAVHAVASPVMRLLNNQQR